MTLVGKFVMHVGEDAEGGAGGFNGEFVEMVGRDFILIRPDPAKHAPPNMSAPPPLGAMLIKAIADLTSMQWIIFDTHADLDAYEAWLFSPERLTVVDNG